MRNDIVSDGLPPRPGGLAFFRLFPASLNRYISLEMCGEVLQNNCKAGEEMAQQEKPEKKDEPDVGNLLVRFDED